MSRFSIPKSVVNDAVAVCGSIYRLNARYACGYVFTISKDRKSVDRGMFAYWREILEGDLIYWEGYIDFEDKTVMDLENGKTRKLE